MIIKCRFNAKVFTIQGYCVTRTVVPWIIIDYNGKLFSKCCPYNPLFFANLDNEIGYFVIIIDFFAKTQSIKIRSNGL